MELQTRRHRRLAWVVRLTLVGQFFVSFAQAAMNLPDGVENILGFVPKSTFQCERDGYFGDIDNDCRIFHLCQRQVSSNGRTEWRHWTYACGNQTMFNQLTLTCAFVDEAIPCRHASQFQYLNEVINKPSEPFLTDADVTSGFSYYSNRIMSDGARARAFQDSQLMAQIGGNGLSSDDRASEFVSEHQPAERANLLDEPVPLISSRNNEPREQQFDPMFVASDANLFARESQQDANSAQSVQVQAANFQPLPANNFQAQQARQVERHVSPANQHNTMQSRQVATPQEQTFTSGRGDDTFSFSILTSHQPGRDFSNFGSSIQQAPAFQVGQNVHHSFAAPPPPPQPFVSPTQGAGTSFVSPTTVASPTTTTLPSQGLQTTSAGSINFSSTTTPTIASTTTTSTTNGLLATTPLATQAPETTEQSSSTIASQPTSTLTPSSFATREQQNSRGTRSNQVRQAANNRRPLSAAFQSSRISALKKEQKHPLVSSEQSALVMRKRTSRAASHQMGPISSEHDFWRHPGRVQFEEAPQFESLILRRRL